MTAVRNARDNVMSSSQIVLNTAPTWHDYIALCKPRVVALIVFTAVAGMLLASPALVPASVLVFGTLGIGLAAAAGATINQLVDQPADTVMNRTRQRPLPTGRIRSGSAGLFAALLCVLSMVLLTAQVNLLTAILTLVSMVGYAVIYTVYLKRATPQNIVIGGAAGAMPPVLGWTAVTGSLDPHALLLFMIIFAWTPPHFWALAIHRRAEYARAGIPMLPVTHGVAFARLQILLYTIILCAVSLLPFATGMSGIVYLAAALILGARFLYHALRLYRGRDPRQPMRTFGYSIQYLALLFAALLVDHYLPGAGFGS